MTIKATTPQNERNMSYHHYHCSALEPDAAGLMHEMFLLSKVGRTQPIHWNNIRLLLAIKYVYSVWSASAMGYDAA